MKTVDIPLGQSTVQTSQTNINSNPDQSDEYERIQIELQKI